MTAVAILGVGTVGELLLGGLLRSGWTAERIVVVARRQERAREIEQRYGVRAVDVAEATQIANTLLIAVKPQDIAGLLNQLVGQVGASHLVISVAAGVPTSFIERQLDADVPVVRAMPNTPALVDEAMSAISPGTYADNPHLAAAEQILLPVGKVLRVPQQQLDAVTALSGSGPAYFFYVVEAMIDAGILLGLPRGIAADLVVQTALGAATMLRDSGEHPVQLREAVTSPGGTTINAIVELEKHSVRAAFISAISAACDRSAELAAGFRPDVH
ncbi:MAG: pyrroline-5-carboxylate reductase [Acidimicrobiales bacterium]|nr:MAG: pyrroline-5-carboxylate reductase [Acidimicrobiales bacterium]